MALDAAPRWYSIYRFWLTLAVGTSLVLTLGGTNYFGPSSKTVTTGRKLAECAFLIMHLEFGLMGDHCSG